MNFISRQTNGTLIHSGLFEYFSGDVKCIWVRVGAIIQVPDHLLKTGFLFYLRNHWFSGTF